MTRNKTEFFRLILIALIITIFAPKTAYTSDCPPYLETTGKFTTYRQMEVLLRHVDRKSDYINVEAVGETSSRKLSIYCVHINDRQIKDSEKLKVLVFARVHGSEPAGMEAVLKFLYEFSDKTHKNRKLYLDRLDLYIVPCLNPDGSISALKRYRETGGYWSSHGRKNGKNLDVNRDYHALETNEARTAVRLFNKIEPHIIIDLHEFSSIPLITGGTGWWRAANFDLLMAAGRHPDVYRPLARMARNIVERKVFKAASDEKIRCEYYAVAGGNFDTTYRQGVTAADYFNLRNALTFLVETAGYEGGEKTIVKRRRIQLLVLNTILKSVINNRNEIKKLTAESKKYAENRDFITVKTGLKPREIAIEGRVVTHMEFHGKVTVNGVEYKSNPRVRFRTGDPGKRIREPLPDYYLLFTGSEDFLNKLLLHGANVFTLKKPLKTNGATISAGTVVIPAKQESSAIIGFILEEEALRQNRFSPRERFIVFKTDRAVNGRNLERVDSVSKIRAVVRSMQEAIFGGKFD